MNWLWEQCVKCRHYDNEACGCKRRTVFVRVHSSAGGTCLVDFIRGEDSFTVLLNSEEVEQWSDLRTEVGGAVFRVEGSL